VCPQVPPLILSGMGTRAMVCTAPEVRGSGVRCEPGPLQPQSHRFKAASTSSGVCACRHRRRDRTRSSSLRASACSVKKPNSRVIGEPEKLRAIAVEQAETLKTDASTRVAPCALKLSGCLRAVAYTRHDDVITRQNSAPLNRRRRDGSG
jgi:hypothetical protein